MKLNDYVTNQLILSNYQIRKNKKISREFKRAKVYNSFRQVKHNKFNSFETLKNEENLLNDENKLFLKLYLKTKKLYPTKITETFKDLIKHYNEINYKIPDLSLKKNLFHQNPLILEGTELTNYFRTNNLNKKLYGKQKHINFIKKEMLMIESINYNKSNTQYNANNILGIGNKSLEQKLNKKEMNYFHVDNIWDKIGEEKKRIKKEKLNQKIIEQKKKNKIKKDIKINVINNNVSNKKQDENYSVDIEKLNTLNPLSQTNNNNYNITNYNSKDTMSSKNSDSINIENKFNSLSNFKIPRSQEINKTIAHKKIRFRLLREEEKNKLLKEIEETKNTLNNKDLMEKNITVENYITKHLTTISKNKNNQTNNEYNDDFENPSNYKRYSDKKKSWFRFSKYFSQRVKPANSIFLNKRIKRSIMKKIIEEKDPNKILDIYMKLNLSIFNHNEIENLIQIYYQKIMNRSQESINSIINLKLGDELICELLDKYVEKSKEKFFKRSSVEKVNKSLDKANEEIKALKRRFLLGKTLKMID